jgi:hypothetical protein
LNPTANVIGVSALAGHPILDGAANVWGSAGLLFYGDFKKDGVVVYESHTGWQLSVGLEFRPGRRR